MRAKAFDSAAQAKRNLRAAIENVAARLGNTPTICRKCYVHPEVLTSFLDGNLVLEIKSAVESELRDALPALRPRRLRSWRCCAAGWNGKPRRALPEPKRGRRRRLHKERYCVAFSCLRPFTQPYDRAELIADAVMHATGLVFAVAGMLWLINQAGGLAGLQNTAVRIYAAGLVTMFAMSAAYNMCPVGTTKLILGGLIIPPFTCSSLPRTRLSSRKQGGARSI